MAAKKPRGVRKVTLPSDAEKWVFCTQVQLPDGARKQVRRRFDKKADAEREYNKTRTQSAERHYTARWNGTVADVVSEYLATATFEKAARHTTLSLMEKLASRCRSSRPGRPLLASFHDGDERTRRGRGPRRRPRRAWPDLRER
jgi:hypothetical protein